ncbi:MAG: GDSL-type esterase/lipase family protein [Bacteroidota bacterium]
MYRILLRNTIILFSAILFLTSLLYGQNTTYWNQKASMYSVLPNQANEIIFLGNSITDRCEWSELFENHNIINRGLSGDRTAGVLNRLQEVIDSNPRKIFIMIGVNDLRHNVGIDSITRNYTKIVETIISESPDTKIFLQSILPVNNIIGKPKTENYQVRDMNSRIRAIAEKFNVTYIDIHSFMVDDAKRLDAQYSEDGLHINGEGYLVWKSVIEKYVNETPADIKSAKAIEIIDVAGRQGVATDSKFYFISGSKDLYKYSKDGKLLTSNKTPFKNLALKANHIGDIDYYRSELYAGVEFFNDGSASNIQIAIYDAKTLKFKRFFKWESASGQKEVSAVSVDSVNKTVWMADWIDGSYLYKYDLITGKYLGKLHIFPVPEKQQGIKVIGKKLYITADDGDAEQGEADHLYSIDLLPGKTSAEVTLVKTFNNVKLNGEIEGLTYDETENNLIIHFNRGTRVVNGIPIGFYPGYTKEIH